MTFAPDVVVANGDHVYWDLRASISAVILGQSPTARRIAGVFDRNRPLLGTANESVLTRAVGPQIAELYGTLLRGVPTFFLRDDHDYFEDDQVTPTLTTFPPDAFMRDLARTSHWLYYPEFLPKPGWPAAWRAQHDRLLAAASAMARPAVFVSGDIHGQAAGRIVASGGLDLRDNPVVSVVSGSIGTGVGWPSAARGTMAMPPAHLALEVITPVQEVNGFHLLDVEPEVVRIHHFRWRRGIDPVEAIDTLQPYHVSEHAR